MLTEDRDLLQEGLVQLPLPNGAAHEDAPVRVPVNGPQFHISLSLWERGRELGRGTGGGGQKGGEGGEVVNNLHTCISDLFSFSSFVCNFMRV